MRDAGRSVWVSFYEGAGGVRDAGRSVRITFAAGAGGVGDAGRSVRVSFYEGAGGMGEPRGDEEPPMEVYAEQPELNAWISPYGARAG